MKNRLFSVGLFVVYTALFWLATNLSLRNICDFYAGVDAELPSITISFLEAPFRIYGKIVAQYPKPRGAYL